MRSLPIKSIDLSGLGPLPDTAIGESGKSLLRYAGEFAGLVGFLTLVGSFAWRAL